MVYPALLPLMRTPRLPVVNWTDAPRRFKWTRPFRWKTKSWFLRVCHHISTGLYLLSKFFFLYRRLSPDWILPRLATDVLVLFVLFFKQLITIEPNFHSSRHFWNIDWVVNLPRKFVGVSWCVVNCYFYIMLVSCQVSGTHSIVIRRYYSPCILHWLMTPVLWMLPFCTIC